MLKVKGKVKNGTILPLEPIDETHEGQEVVISFVEANNEPLAKVSKQKPRIAGLGKGTTWTSEDFDDELPDEFWGFDKEL